MGAGKNLLIVLHVGTNSMTICLLTRIKDNYAKMKMFKDVEAQVILYRILLVLGEDETRQEKLRDSSRTGAIRKVLGQTTSGRYLQT